MIHINCDYWTEGIPTVVHERASALNLTPPEARHPLVQIRDAALAWMGVGVEIFSHDLSAVDRHRYLVRASHALIVLHTGDRSSPLHAHNGGYIPMHPVTGSFGMTATNAWHIAFESRVPCRAFNVKKDSAREAVAFIEDCLLQRRGDSLKIAITGPKDGYLYNDVASWADAMLAPLAHHADSAHKRSVPNPAPLLIQALDEAKSGGAEGESAVIVSAPVTVGKKRRKKPAKSPVAVVVQPVVSPPQARVGRARVGKARPKK